MTMQEEMVAQQQAGGVELGERASPKLTSADIDAIRPYGEIIECPDGCTVFKAGDAAVDLYVVLQGALEMLNASDGNKIITTHRPGHFSGDIDLLTKRPVVVTAIARAHTTLLRVPSAKIRELVNRIPRFGEKLLIAMQVRRQMLTATGKFGLRIIGPTACKDTTIMREFLYKNFVPFTWADTETEEGKEAFREIGSPKKSPAIRFADGKVLLNPTLRELAKAAGLWQECPGKEVDLAIVGAGPAGIAAAVYAASEGLSTLVLDRMGPGGQAGGSSKIENFIGFPAGLSGTDLATRGVLQMLKFGAYMVAPITVEKLEPGKNANDPHKLYLDCGAVVNAGVVLIATGVKWRKLCARGIEKFEGAGIYYACTTVEAFTHEGQDVAVVGAGNSAGQAAMFLAERCARTVHMVIRRELGIGMSSYLAERIRATPNIKVHNCAEVVEVRGDRRIGEIDVQYSDGRETTCLKLTGMFVFIGADPQLDWLPEEVKRDSQGYLMTGPDVERSGDWPLAHRTPCPLETSVPGILAAGDVRSGSTKRVGFAVGDGSLAVTCAHRLRTLRL